MITKLNLLLAASLYHSMKRRERYLWISRLFGFQIPKERNRSFISDSQCSIFYSIEQYATEGQLFLIQFDVQQGTFALQLNLLQIITIKRFRITRCKIMEEPILLPTMILENKLNGVIAFHHT